MTLRIEIKNPEKIERFLKSQSPRMREAAMDAAEDMVLEADRLAKEHARDKSRKPKPVSGRYFNSIHPEIKRSGFRILGVVASDVAYAPALERRFKVLTGAAEKVVEDADRFLDAAMKRKFG